MDYYIGLDVSLSTTFISIVDEKGKIIEEQNMTTDSDVIADFLNKKGLSYKKIGIESGQLSISLCKKLLSKGLNVICVDARHMAAALSARINKNDKNDARGIAQMMRTGLYKEVLVKSDEACRVKILLGSRRQLVRVRQQLNGTIRGLLKIHGIKIGPRSDRNIFNERIRQEIKGLDNISRSSIEELIINVESLEKSLAQLNKLATELCKKDEDCRLLTTVPGVGEITALTYKATIDDAARFNKSEVVGAYVGLSPRQYSSGEIDRHGSISKMGPKECRTMLYEAAQSIITVSKRNSKLKSWGLKLAKKKGTKKAIVAVARKLGVIMHKMLVDRKEFVY